MLETNVAKLRNELFEKYFEINNGINLLELMDILNFLTNIWKNLSKLLEGNIENYKIYDRLENIKKLEYKERNYLIIKFQLWEYLIIDIDNNKVLNQDDIKENFEEEFFITNFLEKPLNMKEHFSNIYWFLDYQGNIRELVDFYVKYSEFLELPTYIKYLIHIDDAWTYLGINIISGNVQLGFQTNNQQLYEQVFFNQDLSPFGLQDAHKKMGIEKMNEIFLRIKDIMIPLKVIPKEILDNENLKKLFAISNMKNELAKIKKEIVLQLDEKPKR